MRRWGTLLALLSSVAAAQTSVSGEWTPVRAWPIAAVHTHLLPTGEVMFSGEFDLGRQMYLWNPVTDTLTRLPDAPYNIFCAGHAYLPDGRLFLAGGHISDDHGLNDASLFDPWTRTFTRLPDMNGGRWYPSVSGLPNGDLLVVAGAKEDGSNNTVPQVWETANGRWRTLSSAVSALPYYPWTFLAPGGRIFVAGPHTPSRWFDTAGTGVYSYGPGTRFGHTRGYGSAVMYRDGKVMITGGAVPPTNTVEVIDLAASSPSFRLVAPLRAARRQHNSTLLPDGTVVVIGGHYGDTLDDPTKGVYETELWNPNTEQWTSLARSSAYRGYHSTALLLPDGRVLSAGSRGRADMQVFSPPYLFKGARPEISAAPAVIAYGSSFSVSTPSPESVARVTLLRIGSVTHAFNMNQRFQELTFTRGSGVLSIAAPSSPDRVLPGHYLLFLLSGDGVPSVAKIVRLGGTAPPPPPPPDPGTSQQIVIPFGSSWRYHDGNVDLGSGWSSPSFDDSGWRTGLAQLGYGDGDERTTLNRTSPAQPTVYFRRMLHLDALPTSAVAKVIKDDGVALFVNGVQVYAHRVGSTAFSAWATSGSLDNEATTATLPVAPFRVGDNTLAAMVKQLNGTSSDVSFDLELALGVESAPVHTDFMLQSPNGGEELRAGTRHTIAWMMHATQLPPEVRLEFSADDGATWTLIGEHLPNSGSYEWTVPAITTTRALVRICACAAGAYTSDEGDQSDGQFTISDSGTWRAIPTGASWRFDDRGIDPGSSWMTADFDDSTWRVGAAELGYGDGDERTQLAHLSPAQPTVYFRRRILLPETIGSAELTVRHDDGVVVFVNGRQAFSKYVGSTAYSAFATQSSAENESSHALLDPSLFTTGDNVIAVAVKQSSGSSSDVSFDLLLTLSTAAAPPAGSAVTAIPFGAVWRYDARGVDLGTDWLSSGYDDTGWPTGPAELGYGDGDEATAFPHRSPTQSSVYFRRHFTAAATPTRATLSALYDDGVAVWINGVQVFSKNVGSTAYAAWATSGSSDNSRITADLPLGAIVPGDNVIQVMVKQVDVSSSDTSFDLKLELELP